MFHFKQFSISQDKTALKVGTDSVVLGSITDFTNCKKILDIGTGTGILALMAAQKSKNAHIDAIEIERNAYEQSKENFLSSKWKNRIRAIHTSLQKHLENSTSRYDLIISNPPYFNSSTKSKCKLAETARHTDTLSYNELCYGVSILLNESGVFHLILPSNNIKNFKWIAFDYGLYCSKETLIQPKQSKDVNLVVMTFEKKICFTKENLLTLRDSEGEYTDNFSEITKEFYL